MRFTLSAGLLALLAGCAPPAPVAHDDFVLPADAYAFTVPETGEIDLARAMLVGQCMQRFGYAFDAAAARDMVTRSSRSTVADLGHYGNKRRYGVTDPAIAARYGYHLVSQVIGEAPEADPDSPPGLGHLSATMRVVLTGRSPAQVNGRPVSKGGCSRMAAEALSPDGVLGEADVVAEVGAQSYRDSFADPTVVAAFARWSRCMYAKGYAYKTPRDAGAEFDVNSATVPAAERAAAEADVGCKQQTHLVDVWHGYEVAVQKARIKGDAAGFKAAKEDHDARMKRVSGVLTGS